MSRDSATGAESHSNPILVQVSPDQCHELRVRIPSDVHRQLLALKILRGVTLAETVTLALDRYFARRGQLPSGEVVTVAVTGAS